MIFMTTPALAAACLLAAPPAPTTLQTAKAEVARIFQEEQAYLQANKIKQERGWKRDPARLAPVEARIRAAATPEERSYWQVAKIFLSVTGQLSLDEAFLAQCKRELTPLMPGWALQPSAFSMYTSPALGWTPEAADAWAKPARDGHTDSEVRAWLTFQACKYRLQTARLDEAKVFLDRLQKEFPNNGLTKTAEGFYVNETKLRLDRPAPAFSVPDLDAPGQTHTLASYRGKYLLLDFWGTWCAFCVKELPEVHKAYARFKGKGLEILSLSTDPKPELVQAFRKKPDSPMPWKHAFLGKGKTNPILDAYAVPGFPSFYLIGPDGKLLAKGMDLRGENLEKTLEKLLK